MYLITGGAGFLGRSLARRLAAGHGSVRIFDIREGKDIPEGVEYLKGDVTRPTDVEAAVKGASVVFNLASLLPCSRAEKEFYRVNVNGTRNILESCLKNDVRHVVYVSSSVVYGIPVELPLKEGSPVRPIGDYGRSKLLAEEACRACAGQGLAVTILRPRFIVGPGRLGLLAILFDWISKGKNVYTIGRGENKFQMVGTADLVEACMLAMERRASGIYNLGADNVPTVKALLSALIKHAATGSRVIAVNARLARAGLALLDALDLAPLVKEHYLIGDKDYVVDTSKAKQELGWVPTQSQTELLKSAYDWYLANNGAIRTKSIPDFPREKLLRILKWFS